MCICIVLDNQWTVFSEELSIGTDKIGLISIWRYCSGFIYVKCICYILHIVRFTFWHELYLFVSRVTPQLPLVEQELFVLPGHWCPFPFMYLTLSLGFCVLFCRSLFVILSFFFWPLHCFSVFALRLLVNPLVASKTKQKHSATLFPESRDYFAEHKCYKTKYVDSPSTYKVFETCSENN